MNENYIAKIAGELKIQARQVAATARLLAEGATVPFIARYRKEATGTLDEVAITSIRDRMLSLVELDQRRESILKSLEERNLLTDELKSAIAKAETLTDARRYLSTLPSQTPHPRHHRERAGAGAARGYSSSTAKPPSIPWPKPKRSSTRPKGVESVEKALAGARDIIAERVSDDAIARAKLRELYWSKALVRSKVMSDKQEAGAKFKDYFDWSEPRLQHPQPSHAGHSSW